MQSQFRQTNLGSTFSKILFYQYDVLHKLIRHFVNGLLKQGVPMASSFTRVLLLTSALSLLHSTTEISSQAAENKNESSPGQPGNSQLQHIGSHGSASHVQFLPAPECRQRHHRDATRADLSASAPIDGKRAVQLAREGRLDDALKIFEALLRENPDDLETREDYIVVLNWAMRDADAIAQFSQLRRELTPDYVVAAVAKSYLNLGRHNEAIDLLQFGQRRSPDYLAFAIGQIATLAETRNIAAAIKLSNQLLQQHPDDPDILLAHARALEADRAFAAAMEVYDRILTVHPERQDINSRRYLVWLEQLPPPGADHLRAVELARQGHISKALSILGRLQQAAPDDLRLLWDYIVVSNWADRHTAVLQLSRSLDRDQAPDYVIEAIAKSARSLKRFDDAAELYRYGRSRWPDAAPFAVGLIRTALEAGKVNDAVELGCQAELDHPKNVDVLLAYAAALKAQGRHSEKREIYDRVLEIDPEHSDVRHLQHAASRRDGQERFANSPQLP